MQYGRRGRRTSGRHTGWLPWRIMRSKRNVRDRAIKGRGLAPVRQQDKPNYKDSNGVAQDNGEGKEGEWRGGRRSTPSPPLLSGKGNSVEIQICLPSSSSSGLPFVSLPPTSLSLFFLLFFSAPSSFFLRTWLPFSAAAATRRN